MKESVAVVGAGMAGLVAARDLAESGYDVRLFDKARGPGGRMATRRGKDGLFDHGAQYFTARDPRFRARVDAWLQEGVVQAWDGRLGVAVAGEVQIKPSSEKRYVGAPRMSALTRHMAVDLDIVYENRVGGLERAGDRWRLYDHRGVGLGTYDVVLMALPPTQAADLVRPSSLLLRQLEGVRMRPCWAAMALFEQPVPLEADGVFINEGPLSWAARDSSKPGRAPGERWVLHGDPAWSETHIEEEAGTVAPILVDGFFTAVGLARPAQVQVQAHRWRYALAAEPLAVGCLWDGEMRLGCCGDWCHKSRVEGAFLSGIEAAQKIKA